LLPFLLLLLFSMSLRLLSMRSGSFVLSAPKRVRFLSFFLALLLAVSRFQLRVLMNSECFLLLPPLPLQQQRPS